MSVESARLTRARRIALSPTAARRIAVAAALSLWAIVATGATVRLTGSGLGCEGWPGCTPGNPFPEKDYHSFVEFGNRMFGLVPITLTLVAAVVTWRVAALPRWAVRLALAVALVTALQAPIGLATVRLDLHPIVVMTHFLLAMLALGAAVLVALEAWRVERADRPTEGTLVLRRLGGVLAASALAVVLSGMFVTSAGPHAGDAGDVERLGRLPVAIAVHVPATAIFGLTLVFLLGYLFARREAAPYLFRLALGLAALVVVQAAVGELQWQTELPWGLVLVHVTLAAAAWAVTVLFAALLWRPLART